MKQKPIKIKTFCLNKNINNRSFMFGDFDEDGIPNADDMYPFNPNKTIQVNPEILLTEELRKIRQHTIPYTKTTKSVAKRVGAKDYRVKTVRSCINKLRRKHLDSFNDIGAMRIYVDKEKDIMPKVKEIRKMYPVIKEKNFYKNPKDGYYVAYHMIIRAGRGERPIEIQIQTKRQGKFYLSKTHENYKRDGFTYDEKRKLKKIMMRNRELDK